MTTRAWMIPALCLAWLIGHFGWRMAVPQSCHDHQISGTHALVGGKDEAAPVYFRRTFHASQAPRHAWLQVIGEDRLDVYVNGEWLGGGAQSGLPVATLLDITSSVTAGRNVIAIRTQNSTKGGTARVSVDGEVELSGERIALAGDEQWRTSQEWERDAAYWFETKFDDGHWQSARPIAKRMEYGVPMPPGSVKVGRRGGWVASQDGGRFAMRREFELGAPWDAWLRVTGACSYRLAVNGEVVDQQEENASPVSPAGAVERTYDLTPLMHRGRNVLALAVESETGAAKLLVDAQATDVGGGVQELHSDSAWMYSNDWPADWYAMRTSATSWHSALASPGDQGANPAAVEREPVAIALSWGRLLVDVSGRVALAGIAACLLCWLRAQIGKRRAPAGKVALDEASARRFDVACAPAALFLVAAWIISLDSRIAAQSVYRWWALAGAMAVGAGAMLAGKVAADRARRGFASESSNAPSWRLERVAVAAALVVGFGIRAWGIGDPLSADEMSVFRASKGFIERGFPSVEVHPDMPIAYVATSELVYLPTALVALVSDDPNTVVRVPAALWGTATILLIWMAGRRLFGPGVGLTAMAVYALAPTCVQMSNFGRYFSQLQFFALLTVWQFHELVSRKEEIRGAKLWGTAASFVAMFLSWEASALLAPGMILAALLARRERLRSMVINPKVWLAVLMVGSVVVLQDGHRGIQQAQRLAYGTGASDVSITMMWRYPGFEPLYYIWQSSWTRDALLPMVGLAGAVLVATRHGWRRPTRTLLIVFGCTAMLQSMLLPVRAWRYSYHLTPLMILAASAAACAGARWLGRRSAVRRSSATPATERAFGGFGNWVSAAWVVALVWLSSAFATRQDELTSFRVAGSGLADYKFPDMQSPSEFLRRELREGDVVLASGPHVVDELLPRKADYWPQTRLHLQAVLDDHRTLPLHRLAGTVMVPTLEELDGIFARHERIWFLSVPSFDAKLNHDSVTAYLRDRMSVVREDFSSQLLYFGDEHRPASQRLKDRAALTRARVYTPPAEWW